MDIGLVLEHLRAQFKEQMVLYAGDLAKILNKSEKAVQQLISRGSLPFQVKIDWWPEMCRYLPGRKVAGK